MKVVFNYAVAAATVALVGASTARADRRMYAETYEAVTAPKGELDVESWTTYARAGEVDGGPASRGVRQMIELEYGLTDRWDIALYNMFDAITSGDTQSGYAGLKLESRFRPTFRGEWFVDPIFYVELQQRFRGDADQSAEFKLIVAKDLGRVNVAANVAFEVERKTDGSANPELEWAFGTAYEVGGGAVGVETFGTYESDGTRVWVGPAISVALGAPKHMRGIWVTLGAGAGLTAVSDAVYVRTIIGLQF